MPFLPPTRPVVPAGMGLTVVYRTNSFNCLNLNKVFKCVHVVQVSINHSSAPHAVSHGAYKPAGGRDGCAACPSPALFLYVVHSGLRECASWCRSLHLSLGSPWRTSLCAARTKTLGTRSLRQCPSRTTPEAFGVNYDDPHEVAEVP